MPRDSDHEPLVSRPPPDKPSRHRVAAAMLVLAAIVAVVAIFARPSGQRVVPPDVELTVTPTEARLVLDAFVRSANAGEIDAAFDRFGDVVRSNPERIQVFFGSVAPDFGQEMDYARWTAELGAEWLVDQCSIRQWVRLSNGVRQPKDAQLLSCTGSYTTAFFAAIDHEPMAVDITVAVDGDLDIVLYQVLVSDSADTRVYLQFRRWLQERYPEDELRVFTRGGTPLTTADAASVMMRHARAFGADRREHPEILESPPPPPRGLSPLWPDSSAT